MCRWNRWYFVTPFCTGKSGVEDEITPEELKREYARRRYLEMTDFVTSRNFYGMLNSPKL